MAKISFSVGDKVKDSERGFGVIKKIDTSNLDFFYFVDFTGKGGKGSLVWLSKKYVEGLK